MESAYSYKYMATPPDYYDYDYDINTITEIPNRNFYKNKNTLLRRLQQTDSRDAHYGMSGYGGGCYEEGVSIGLLLTTAFGIAIMGYTLYTKIVANGGKRRKRSLVDNLYDKCFSLLPTITLSGKYKGSFKIEHICY